MTDEEIKHLQRQINDLRTQMHSWRYLEKPIQIKDGHVFIGGTGKDVTIGVGGTDTDITLTATDDIDLTATGDISLTASSDIFLTATANTVITSGGVVYIGDIPTGNYSAFDASGQLSMNAAATVFNDANMGALAFKTGGTLPGTVEWLDNDGDATGIYTLGFAVNEQGGGSIEIPHDYKEGSDITFHVHWGANDAPTGTDNVKWQLIYSVTRSETTFPDAVTIDTGDVAYDTQYETKRSDFPAITGTNFKIGDQFNFQLKRIASSGDAYAGEALVETAGFHYECDSLGSRTITTK
jgi:hypothetical protein